MHLNAHSHDVLGWRGFATSPLTWHSSLVSLQQPALGVPVDVTEGGPVDRLHREAALEHPALHLLDPGLCLMDVTNLEQSYGGEERPTFRGLHNRSATALARGHSRGVRFTELTNSLHIHVSPPETSMVSQVSRRHKLTNDEGLLLLSSIEV